MADGSLVDEGSRSRPRRESVYLGFTSDKPPHGDDKDDAFDEEDDAPPVPMRGTVHQQMRQERSASGAYGFSRNFSAENEEDPFDIDSISETIEYEKDDKPLKRRGLRRQGSVYEGFKGDAPKESDAGGHEDAAGNWVPEEDEEEADSDDEWADTGQTRRKQTTEDALDALTLNEYNGGPIDDDDDLLLTDREQVLLFGGGLTGSTCTKAGWIRKANGFSAAKAQYSRSKPRWFELHTDTLYYYRQVPPDFGREKPLGFITISPEVKVSGHGGRVIILTTHKRPYHLFFDTPKEHAAWLYAIADTADASM